jgi:hypothetical protein
MDHEHVDLAYRLLDLDLVDSTGRRCGKVDDLEFSGGPGQTVYVAAIVTGTGAFPGRFIRPLRRYAARIFRGKTTRIAWRTVGEVQAVVELTRTAAQLDLATGDRKLGAIFERQEGG